MRHHKAEISGEIKYPLHCILENSIAKNSIMISGFFFSRKLIKIGFNLPNNTWEPFTIHLIFWFTYMYKVKKLKPSSGSGKNITGFRCSSIQVAEQNKRWFHIHGLRARARPNLGAAAWVAFGSYSAEKVISDFGLHSCWHSIAALPLSENRVFTTVNGSTAWELPMVKLFSKEDNLWVISAATECKGFTEWT